MDFSGDISVTFARISKVVSVMNSANISTSDRVDESEFFLWFWIPRLGFLISGGLRRRKGTPAQCRLSLSVPLVFH